MSFNVLCCVRRWKLNKKQHVTSNMLLMTVQPIKLLVSQPVQRSTVTLGSSILTAIFVKLFFSSSNLFSFEFTATLETGCSTSCMKVRNQLCSTMEIANPPFPHKFLTMEVRILSWFLNGSLVLRMNILSLLNFC